MTEACVFCDLIRDDSVAWVAAEEHALAFEGLPDDTLAPGHTLVVPRNHCEGLLGSSDEEFAAVMSLVRRVAEAMRTELGSTGTYLIQASGPDSGGTVPHLHVHVLPCWADDNVSFWPVGRSEHITQGDPYAAIRAALQR